MKYLLLIGLLAVGVVTPGWAQVDGHLNALRRPGETKLFSFKTASGKTAVLCEGPRGAYLVYRFGTVTKVELQYPAVLTATSWRKFAYYPYHRTATPQAERYRLSFSSGGNGYELVDMTETVTTEGGDEECPREVGVWVTTSKGKIVRLVGKQTSVQGDLLLSEEQQARVKMYGDE
jgi:hypothetical protein